MRRLQFTAVLLCLSLVLTACDEDDPTSPRLQAIDFELVEVNGSPLPTILDPDTSAFLGICTPEYLAGRLTLMQSESDFERALVIRRVCIDNSGLTRVTRPMRVIRGAYVVRNGTIYLGRAAPFGGDWVQAEFSSSEILWSTANPESQDTVELLFRRR